VCHLVLHIFHTSRKSPFWKNRYPWILWLQLSPEFLHTFLIPFLYLKDDGASIPRRLLCFLYLRFHPRISTETGIFAPTVQISRARLACYDKLLPVVCLVDGQGGTLVPRAPSKIRYFSRPGLFPGEIGAPWLIRRHLFVPKALL
jgi:hypothetical protein